MSTAPKSRRSAPVLVKAATELSYDELRALLAAKAADPLFALIRKATAEVRVLMTPKKAETFVPSTEEKRVEKALTLAKSHFSGGHMKGITHILAALMEVDVKKFSKFYEGSGESPSTSSLMVTGALIVATKNPNSHDYGTKPFLVYRPGRSNHLRLFTDKGTVRDSLSTGNNLPDDATCIRAATEAEVEDTITKLQEQKKLLEMIITHAEFKERFNLV